MIFQRRASILIYASIISVVLGVLALFELGPFLWLLSTALKSSGDIFKTPPELIPKHATLQNFVYVWKTASIPEYFLNSLIVSILSVVLNVVLAAMVAYPLARMNFRGRNVVFIAILATMIIPFQSIMLPIFLVCKYLGILNSYLGVVLPTAVTAIGVFLLRQAFRNIPIELEEAARIDGCSDLRIWYQIMLPLIKPSMTTLAIITFTASWSDFLWPLIVLRDPGKFTLPVGLQYFMSIFTSNWHHISAISIIAVIPTLILFLLLQRYFYAGALTGSVKG